VSRQAGWLSLYGREMSGQITILEKFFLSGNVAGNTSLQADNVLAFLGTNIGFKSNYSARYLLDYRNNSLVFSN